MGVNGSAADGTDGTDGTAAATEAAASAVAALACMVTGVVKAVMEATVASGGDWRGGRVGGDAVDEVDGATEEDLDVDTAAVAAAATGLAEAVERAETSRGGGCGGVGAGGGRVDDVDESIEEEVDVVDEVERAERTGADVAAGAGAIVGTCWTGGDVHVTLLVEGNDTTGGAVTALAVGAVRDLDFRPDTAGVMNASISKSTTGRCMC